MNPIRSIIAVLGGIALVSVVVEALEFTLVMAAAGESIADPSGGPDPSRYFAVRNRPSILAAKLVYNTLAAVLGGYMAAKIAGNHEMLHAGAVALVQTVALVWGFTMSEYAPFTPVWMRTALVLLTAPAMLAGGSIRARAARSQP